MHLHMQVISLQDLPGYITVSNFKVQEKMHLLNESESYTISHVLNDEILD